MKIKFQNFYNSLLINFKKKTQLENSSKFKYKLFILHKFSYNTLYQAF